MGDVAVAAAATEAIEGAEEEAAGDDDAAAAAVDPAAAGVVTIRVAGAPRGGRCPSRCAATAALRPRSLVDSGQTAGATPNAPTDRPSGRGPAVAGAAGTNAAMVPRPSTAGKRAPRGTHKRKGREGQEEPTHGGSSDPS